jgi:hypothetical protein
MERSRRRTGSSAQLLPDDPITSARRVFYALTSEHEKALDC